MNTKKKSKCNTIIRLLSQGINEYKNKSVKFGLLWLLMQTKLITSSSIAWQINLVWEKTFTEQCNTSNLYKCQCKCIYCLSTYIKHCCCVRALSSQEGYVYREFRSEFNSFMRSCPSLPRLLQCPSFQYLNLT